MSLRRPNVARTVVYISIWALYVVSLWRPTAALLIYFTFRGVASDTRSVFSYFIGISGGLPPDFLFIYRAVQFIIWVRITNLLMCIMFAFVISYVQTVLRVHSKYSPGLLIWPDVDEGDLMDEEFDSESDA